jgi:hypothetical protein
MREIQAEKLRMQALTRMNFLQRQLLEIQPHVCTPRDLKNLQRAKDKVNEITTELTELLEAMRKDRLL